MGDGPPGFRRNFACSAVLRILVGLRWISHTGLLHCLARLSSRLLLSIAVPCPSPTTPESKLSGLGFSRFARRYSGNRFFFLFLRVLRCFSSPRLPRQGYVFTLPQHPTRGAGLPHSEISGSQLTYSSPEQYRCSSRPSSAPSAKASTVRPSSLNLWSSMPVRAFTKCRITASCRTQRFYAVKLLVFS